MNGLRIYHRPRLLCASSTSALLYISPYPLTLGVSLPAISLFFLAISSMARCLSLDSRFNLASRGSSAGGAIRLGLREDEGLEVAS